MAVESVCYKIARDRPLRWVDFTTTRHRREDGILVYRVSYRAEDVGTVQPIDLSGIRQWNAVRETDGEVLIGPRDTRGDVYRDLMRDHLKRLGELPEGAR